MFFKTVPWWGWILLVLAVGAGVWGYKHVQARTVGVVHPHVGEAVQAVYATGNVEATRTMTVAPRTGGRLVDVKVHEGDAVKAGDVLATMESEDLAANVDALRAKAVYARAAAARLAKLVEGQAVSKDAYQAAVSAAKAADEALRQAEAQLHYTNLVALDDGIVVQHDGDAGSFVSTGQPVFWLSGGPLRITAQVDEEDIAHVKEGLPVAIQSDDLPGRLVSGTVVGVTPRGDAVTRSFRVRISLPEDTGLKIGMTTEVNIIFHRADKAVLVPSSAVRDGAVWVVKNGAVRKVPVDVGTVGLNDTEILRGVGTGDAVVAVPSASLKDGDSVWVKAARVKPATPAPAEGDD